MYRYIKSGISSHGMEKWNHLRGGSLSTSIGKECKCIGESLIILRNTHLLQVTYKRTRVTNI